MKLKKQQQRKGERKMGEEKKTKGKGENFKVKRRTRK